MSKERAVFQLLWDMYNRARESDRPAQVISNYAGIIDDRLENKGNSQSTNSLKLYTIDQLQEEIDERQSDD